jgi:hypothetical protein
MRGRIVVAGVVLTAACGGGPTQVQFVSNERPSSQGAPQDLTPSAAHHEHPNGTVTLPNDERIVEPDRPLVETKQERALVHIHTPEGVVCSGVIMGSRFVATSQQCVKGESKGATAVASNREYKVELASSALTWTSRQVKFAIVPSCEVDDLDVAILVLNEPAPWVEPLRVVSSPPPGGRVQALGFGHCAGETRPLKARHGVIRSRASEAVVIDVPLCRGDVGGPVVEGEGVIGLISHRDDPEGSPLRTTTIARLDTQPARDLIGQAQKVADGGDASTLPPIACH